MGDWVIAAAALLLTGGSVWAQQLVVDFDPAKTQINWTLGGNVHTVHGTFHLQQGHVTVNTGTGAISGDLVADAASGESGNGSRDKRMHKEILESARYPEIRLTPKKIEGSMNLSGHSTIHFSGTFLIHGTTHEVNIPIDVGFVGGTVTGTGKFSIPYVDWGMKDPSNFLFKVDKSVDVELVAVGRFTR